MRARGQHIFKVLFVNVVLPALNANGFGLSPGYHLPVDGEVGREVFEQTYLVVREIEEDTEYLRAEGADGLHMRLLEVGILQREGPLWYLGQGLACDSLVRDVGHDDLALVGSVDEELFDLIAALAALEVALHYKHVAVQARLGLLDLFEVDEQVAGRLDLHASALVRAEPVALLLEGQVDDCQSQKRLIDRAIREWEIGREEPFECSFSADVPRKVPPEGVGLDQVPRLLPLLDLIVLSLRILFGGVHLLED